MMSFGAPRVVLKETLMRPARWTFDMRDRT